MSHQSCILVNEQPGLVIVQYTGAKSISTYILPPTLQRHSSILLLTLPHKELLLLQALLILTTRTSQPHLSTTNLVVPQMTPRKIRQRLDESGAPVQTLGSPYPTLSTKLIRLMDHFLVDLEQSFDVV